MLININLIMIIELGDIQDRWVEWRHYYHKMKPYSALKAKIPMGDQFGNFCAI